MTIPLDMLIKQARLRNRQESLVDIGIVDGRVVALEENLNRETNSVIDAEGNLVATGRFVAVANLPLLLRKNVFQKFKSFQIKDIIEFVQGNETSYLVSIENEKSKLLVHGYANGYSYIFKKEKKNSLAKL